MQKWQTHPAIGRSRPFTCLRCAVCRNIRPRQLHSSTPYRAEDSSKSQDSAAPGPPRPNRAQRLREASADVQRLYKSSTAAKASPQPRVSPAEPGAQSSSREGASLDARNLGARPTGPIARRRLPSTESNTNEIRRSNGESSKPDDRPKTGNSFSISYVSEGPDQPGSDTRPPGRSTSPRTGGRQDRPRGRSDSAAADMPRRAGGEFDSDKPSRGRGRRRGGDGDGSSGGGGGGGSRGRVQPREPEQDGGDEEYELDPEYAAYEAERAAALAPKPVPFEPTLMTRESLLGSGPNIVSGVWGMREVLEGKKKMAERYLENKDWVEHKGSWVSQRQKDEVRSAAAELQLAAAAGDKDGKDGETKTKKDKEKEKNTGMVTQLLSGSYIDTHPQLLTPHQQDVLVQIGRQTAHNSSYIPSDQQGLMGKVQKLVAGSVRPPPPSSPSSASQRERKAKAKA